MIRTLLATVAFTLLGLPLAPRAAAAEPFQIIPAEQVQQMLGAKDVRVYDVNVDELWEKHHLPGAVHVGARDLASLLPADKSLRLVFYCTGPK